MRFHEIELSGRTWGGGWRMPIRVMTIAAAAIAAVAIGSALPAKRLLLSNRSALLLSLPGWIAANDAADHWQGGHRGMIASRLIEQLSDRTGSSSVTSEPGPGRFAQRLRTRLKRD